MVKLECTSTALSAAVSAMVEQLLLGAPQPPPGDDGAAARCYRDWEQRLRKVSAEGVRGDPSYTTETLPQEKAARDRVQSRKEKRVRVENIPIPLPPDGSFPVTLISGFRISGSPFAGASATSSPAESTTRSLRTFPSSRRRKD